MRRHDITSEQLDIISDTLIEYQARLIKSIDSAKWSGLPGLLATESQCLNTTNQALDVVRDVRTTEV